MNGILKKKNLGIILLLNESENILYKGTFYQSNYGNRITWVNDNNFTEKIIIPKLNCINGFDYSDLIDNSYYSNGNINNNIRYYDIETMGATYINDGDYYNDRYLIAPFIKNLRM